MAEYLFPGPARAQWYMEKSTGDSVLLIGNTVVLRVTSAGVVTFTSLTGDVTGDVTGSLTMGATDSVAGATANSLAAFAIAGAQETISTDAQAVSVVNYMTLLDATSAATQSTMANGTVIGQLKKVQCVDATNTCDIDYTDSAGSAATITYNNTGEATLFQYNGTGWAVLSNYNESSGSATGGVIS